MAEMCSALDLSIDSLGFKLVSHYQLFTSFSVLVETAA